MTDAERELLAVVYSSPEAKIKVTEFDYLNAQNYELVRVNDKGTLVYAVRHKDNIDHRERFNRVFGLACGKG